MAKICNKNIEKVIQLAREMIVLADNGDINRTDRSCGVLYGVLRDSAYKLIKMAESEKMLHKDNGSWDIIDDNYTQINNSNF